ncbi:MAG TPA: MOSC domain-containing protein [Acidimicrobiales bacterium]|nr:MOSC domain-containing protein [Acidimicrobiales bacterium]
MSAVETIGTVRSVNVGRPRTVEHRGRPATTGIWKEPVPGPVVVEGVNLAGDDQADRRVHGGPDKAVYAYAGEDYAYWSAELGRALAPGTFGENLTLAGVDLTGAVVGDRWLVGTAVLEVCQPRTPCWKLGLRMGNDKFPARFNQAGRPGAYLRIARPGEVSPGDEVVHFHRPEHGITVGQVARARLDPTLAPALLDAPELPSSVLAWAAHQVRPEG